MNFVEGSTNYNLNSRTNKKMNKFIKKLIETIKINKLQNLKLQKLN